MNPTIVVLFVAVLGALARTLVPYLETLRDKPETPFDRKFLMPPIMSCVIALITLPLALSAMPKELLELPRCRFRVWWPCSWLCGARQMWYVQDKSSLARCSLTLNQKGKVWRICLDFGAGGPRGHCHSGAAWPGHW
jgi:hypothetical protein